MNNMRASDELNEGQVRQLLFDLESSYNAFMRLLGGGGSGGGGGGGSAA